MKAPELQYQLRDAGSIGEVMTALSSQFQLTSEPEQSVRHTLHDSFDWRLFQAGLQLDEVQGQGRHELTLRKLDDGTACETIRLEGSVGGFYQAYPPGLLRDRLAAALQMRSLLPQVEVRCRERLLSVLDNERKTVVRVALREHAARPPGRGEYQPMAALVRLLPVRGYAKPLTQLGRFLADTLELQPQREPLIVLGLAAIGRQPLDYSSKLDIELHPRMPAGEVARQIHLTLLETLESNLPGTRADLDSEFLHDLRVAVRRTRSALSQIKGVFPKAEMEAFQERFAWVGQLTGPTRDLDVYLLGFNEYRNSLPEPFRPDLEPLHEFLVRHQQAEHQTMVRKLNSPHFHRLMKEWRGFLQATPGAEPSLEQAAPQAGKPIAKLAGKRIHRTFGRVLKEGLAINSHSPPEALHGLRKRCKKLRYLLEFFQSLYPADQVKPLIKRLKGLLDNLGEFQDLEVQADKLREFAHQMVAEGEVPADTLLAMGMLVDGLLRRQQESRLAFAERFARFADADQLATFEQLFGKAGKKRAESGGTV
ncbi:CHAD domain-containing protein [Sedimenticola hydrogenitrophicus]|uniref:CHAD domain-containing protein n=1 Tax=Sedimenticola hydrogenitrophicus TaxID=2967975 RepID=UPI0021A7F4EA|nr:CHAD domain-containing protein [Sedimenticola hydrogenitrophicus]